MESILWIKKIIFKFSDLVSEREILEKDAEKRKESIAQLEARVQQLELEERHQAAQIKENISHLNDRDQSIREAKLKISKISAEKQELMKSIETWQSKHIKATGALVELSDRIKTVEENSRTRFEILSKLFFDWLKRGSGWYLSRPNEALKYSKLQVLINFS